MQSTFLDHQKKLYDWKFLRTETAYFLISNFSNQIVQVCDTQIHTKKKTFSHTSSTWSQGTETHPTHTMYPSTLHTFCIYIYERGWWSLGYVGMLCGQVEDVRVSKDSFGDFLNLGRACIRVLQGLSVYSRHRKRYVFFFSIYILTPCIF